MVGGGWTGWGVPPQMGTSLGVPSQLWQPPGPSSRVGPKVCVWPQGLRGEGCWPGPPQAPVCSCSTQRASGPLQSESNKTALKQNHKCPLKKILLSDLLPQISLFACFCRGRSPGQVPRRRTAGGLSAAREGESGPSPLGRTQTQTLERWSCASVSCSPKQSWTPCPASYYCTDPGVNQQARQLAPPPGLTRAS